LRRELLPGQPRKFAMLAEGPIEDILQLQREIEQLTSAIATTPAEARIFHVSATNSFGFLVSIVQEDQTKGQRCCSLLGRLI
jgi:hypothetical protein